METEVIIESAASSDLFSNKYLPVKNNLLLYLIKLYLIKQLFYLTFWILADYNRFISTLICYLSANIQCGLVE